MNIYLSSDYRNVLRALVKERKQFEPAFGFHRLADAARIQRPYLSKVMKGTAQLSADQLFLMANFLQLGAGEQDYLQLLLEHDRTAVAERRAQLAVRIRGIAAQRRDSGAHLSAKTIDARMDGAQALGDYYLDPLLQIVHVAISVDFFSRQTAALAGELNLSGIQLHGLLGTLERLGLAYREGQQWRAREPALHLPKASPLYRAWRNQMKLAALQRLGQVDPEEAYAFSAVFSADAATKAFVHDRFLEFLRSVEGAVQRAPARQVFQMAFDLFPWTTAK